MTKIDYGYKARVLSTDLCKKVNQIDKAIYAKHLLDTSGELLANTLDYDTALRERCFLMKQDERAYKEAEKLNKARYKRVTRLKSRISSMLRTSPTVVFLTLTFTDKVLQNTTEETRRKYVRRFLSDRSENYVANIDFGAKNHREHYHAVIDCKVPTSDWQFGHALAEIVQAPEDKKRVPKRYLNLSEEEQKRLVKQDNEKRLAKYIAKLTNHAIKETTRRSAIIYSSPKNRSLRQVSTKDDDLLVIRTKKGNHALLIACDDNLPF